MNVKKIIKGVIGLGAAAGVAYLSYKIGESNGEINERFRDKYGEDDEDGIEFDEEEDEEPLSNYYGTCFEPEYDEPDDGCLAPNITPEPTIDKESDEKNKAVQTNEVTDKMSANSVVTAEPERKLPPLSSIHIKGFSSWEIEDILLWMIRRGTFFKQNIKDHLYIGDKRANMICDAFMRAGYIRREENGKKLYCNLTKGDFCGLLVEKRGV